MRRLTVGAVLAVVTVAATRANPPAPSEVSTLVAQLGSDDYRAREQAGKALLAMGDRALPALRDALKTVADPEAHRRAEADAVVDRRVEQHPPAFTGDERRPRRERAGFDRRAGHRVTDDRRELAGEQTSPALGRARWCRVGHDVAARRRALTSTCACARRSAC